MIQTEMFPLNSRILLKIYQLRDKFFVTHFGRHLQFSQRMFSNIIIRKLLNNEGGTCGAEFSRQSGKTEIVALTCVFLLCYYLKLMTELGSKSAPEEFNIGIFAPQQEQSKTDFDRIKLYLKKLKNKGYEIKFSEFNGTTITAESDNEVIKHCYCFSASPTSNTESKTLHLIIHEEAHNLLNEKIDNTISPMGAACVCAKTKLLTENGHYVNIEDLKNEKIFGNKNSVNKCSQTFTNEKQCYEIKTNSGRKLQCSFDHPILIKLRSTRKLKWIQTEQLKVGQQISIIDKVNVFKGRKKFFDARLVGMLIGDGTYGKKQMVGYCSCDKELLNYVKQKYEFKVYNSYITKTGKVFEDGTIKGLCDKLRQIGIYEQTKQKKRLPDNIYHYTKKEICELIGGFYDTDGCIVIEENRRGKIYLDSACKPLLKQVFWLLEKMGVHGSIYKMITKNNIVGKDGVSYRYVIREKKSIERFYKNINFLVKYKQNKLINLIKILKQRKCKRQKNVDGLYFERIININQIGKQVVYNLTTEPSHTYLANNIVTHNTNAVKVFIGTAGYKKCRFWEIVEHAEPSDFVIADCDAIIKEKRELYEKTGNEFFLNYEKYIQEEKNVLGEDSDAFRTQYRLQWILERGQFITYKQIMELETEFDKVESYGTGYTLYGGIDWGKMHDSTIFTIIDSEGRILDWLEMKGDAYNEQWDMIEIFIKDRYHLGLKTIYCDGTATQDAIVDELKRRMRKFNIKVRGIKFSIQTKDQMYKNLYKLMRPRIFNDVVVEPALIKIPKTNTVEKGKFISQMCDLQKEIKNGLWSCNHPQGANFHDDYCDSMALACIGITQIMKRKGKKRRYSMH